jgi:hypothetical protein
MKKAMTIRVLRAVNNRLTKIVTSACLRRDEYLAAVLEREIEELDTEISIKNTDRARAFIKKNINYLNEGVERVQVSFSIPAVLVDRIDSVCREKGILRDSFLNRVLFVIVAPNNVVDEIFFSGFEDWRNEVWVEGRNESLAWSHLFHPLDRSIDPFWAIRFGIELDCQRRIREGYSSPQRSGFYSTVFDDSLGVNLYGLNCYLEEGSIPGSEQYDEGRRKLESLFGDVIDFSHSPSLAREAQRRNLNRLLVAGKVGTDSEFGGGDVRS